MKITAQDKGFFILATGAVIWTKFILYGLCHPEGRFRNIEPFAIPKPKGFQQEMKKKFPYLSSEKPKNDNEWVRETQPFMAR